MTEKRTSISQKLLAAMAIPVIFVALIAGSRVVGARTERGKVHAQVELASATGGPATLMQKLLDERNIVGLEMLGFADVVKLVGVTTSSAAASATDEAMNAFKQFIDGSSDEVRGIYAEPYETAVKALEKSRADFHSYGGSKTLVVGKDVSDPAVKDQLSGAKRYYDNYTRIIQIFVDANKITIERIDDAELRNRATALAEQTVQLETLSRMTRTAALAALNDGFATAGERAEVARLYERYTTAKATMIRSLENDKERQAVAEGYFNRPSFVPFETLINAYLDRVDPQTGKPLKSDEPDMSINGALAIMSAASGTITEGEKAVVAQPSSQKVGVALEENLSARADKLTGDANGKVWSNILLFLFSAGLSVIAAILIAKSISRPLLTLAAQARTMSSKELPDAVGSVLETPVGQQVVEPHLAPLTVKSHDEVADVASALTEVQDRALSLAVEQAALRHNFADAFVNLGRRMQSLILRQLEFITDLEDAETDESALADLFKLDHIATRIRRNAESLIVLGGVDTRTTTRLEPMEAVDTVRAALSEVEDYQRVVIDDFESVQLPGDVAADVSHVISELLENGLMFSPPESDVVVTGRMHNSGFLFTVTDHGIGMDDEAIAAANRRLSGEEKFAVAPSRYLGHYIAGHLSTRIGAVARLSRGKRDGIVAEVFLPAKLIMATPKNAQ